MEAKFSELLGKTITSIETTDNEIKFVTTVGVYVSYHSQDCCEDVRIYDIAGDLDDLIGNPLLEAEEITNDQETFGLIKNPDSFTWTFYKLATIKGFVTIRWLGESNGYYSETVDFIKL